MCCPAKTVGFAALAFGGGVLLCMILPSVALACVEAGLITAAGVLLFAK